MGEKHTIGTIKNNQTGELSSTPEEALQLLLKAHFPDQETGDPVQPGEEEEEQNQVITHDENLVVYGNPNFHPDLVIMAFSLF